MNDKITESIGFTLILIGSLMSYIAIAFTLNRLLGEIYAINIMAVATLTCGIILYKMAKRKEGEK